MAAAHIQSLVRAADYPAFLTCFFYPRHLRLAFLAVRAFNVEIAAVRHAARSPPLRAIKYKWWANALDDIYSHNTLSHSFQHPVVSAVAAARRQIPSLRKYHLQQLIKARETDRPLLSIHDTAQHAMLTSYSIFALQKSILMSDEVSATSHADNNIIDHALTHAATASTIAALLFATPQAIATERAVLLPRDVLSDFEISDASLISHGEWTPNLPFAVQELEAIALSELETASSELTKASDASLLTMRPLLLSLTCARQSLTLIKRCGHNLFDRRLSRQNWLLPFALLYQSKRLVPS